MADSSSTTQLAPELAALPQPGTHQQGTGPLAGLRVIDMSRVMAGNMLSSQLADMMTGLYGFGAVLAAAESTSYRENGVVELQGRMIDAPVVAQARQVLAS